MNHAQIRQEAIDYGVIPDLGGPKDGHLMQNPSELADFILWLEDRGITGGRYLEIGVSYGGLMNFMNRLGFTGFGIDPFKPTDISQDQVFPDLSTSPGAYKFAESNAPYKFVFIDGDHSFNSIHYDYKTYSKFADIIAFHDIAGLRNCEGAKLYWEKIKHAYPDKVTEFISDDPLYQAGIGVLCME